MPDVQEDHETCRSSASATSAGDGYFSFRVHGLVLSGATGWYWCFSKLQEPQVGVENRKELGSFSGGLREASRGGHCETASIHHLGLRQNLPSQQPN